MEMLDYERLGYLDIINTYKDALIQKKGPNYLFKESHNAQNSNSMASMSSDSQYRLTKESFDQFWIIISLLRVISSILIHLEPLFSSPGPFLGQNRAQRLFFDQKIHFKANNFK